MQVYAVHCAEEHSSRIGDTSPYLVLVLLQADCEQAARHSYSTNLGLLRTRTNGNHLPSMGRFLNEKTPLVCLLGPIAQHCMSE